MKLENVIRIYRRTYTDDDYFYTILMDYNPWKVCYSGGCSLHHSYMNPESVVNIDKSEFNLAHNAVSNVDPWIEKFFLANDVSKWRKAEEVIPKDRMEKIQDGSSIGLIWKDGTTVKEIVYDQNVYPDDIPFPEFAKLLSLIDHLDKVRKKY